jgi:MFS family permease
MSDAQSAPSPLSHRAMALLKRGPFARYALGEAVSMTGTWMQAMAQGWLMTGLTIKLANPAFMLGMVTFASSLPMLLLTMYGGTVADRYDKRAVLLATQVVQIILTLSIGWLVLTGGVQIWHIIAAAALLGISAAFEMPSASALVPELVDKENISAAIAIDRAIFHGTRLIGPAVAGYLIGKLGLASAFFANALSFLALIVAILTIQPRAKGTAEEERQRASGMKAGIDYVRGDTPTLAMLALMAAGSLCIFPFMAVTMPLYARQELHLGADKTGLLMAVSGIGSLIASVGLLSVPRPHRIAWMIAATVDIGLSMVGLATAHSFAMAALSLATLTVGTALNFGLANITVQERAPGPLRGRVSALAAMSFVGVMPFASLGVPGLADYIGMRTTMVVCAGVYALAAFFVFTGPGRRCSHLPAERTAAVPVKV